MQRTKAQGGGDDRHLDLVPLGTVGKARGLRGEVHVLPFYPDSPLWVAGQELTLVSSPRPGHVWAAGEAVTVVPRRWARSVILTRVGRGAKGRMTVAFQGVASREAAEVLRGALLGLPPAALPALEEGEIYLSELVGYEVRGTGGEVLGTVTDVLALHQDLLEITPRSGGAAYLLPFVRELVPEVDRAGRWVVIDPPEGLDASAPTPAPGRTP